MIITVSGDAGTGTTSLAKHLSTTLALPYFHAGAIFRRLAADRGISVVDIVALAERDLSLDRYVEAELLQLMRSQTAMVVEGRLTSYQAWKNAISSFRILLTASPAIQAKRISQREHTEYAQALREVQYRDHQDWLRYDELYHISIADQNIWNNIVIDTDHLSLEEVYQQCLQAIQSHRL